MNSICAVVGGVSLCLYYNKSAGFSKAAVNFIGIVPLSTNKDQQKILFGSEGVRSDKIFRKKTLHGQGWKELFRKMKNVHMEIYNIHIYFQRT